MRTVTATVVLGLMGVLAGPVLGQEYKLDPSHMSFYFKVSHLGYSDTYGRFNTAQGTMTLAGSDSRFEIVIDAQSIDTGWEKRDEHLRSPDFFDVKQFPRLSFKSNSVSVSGETWTVGGDLTIHGVTRPVTFELTRLKEGQDPWGKQRVGFSTQHSIKRSDFGMTKMLPQIGDEVTLMISFEGVAE